MRDGTSTGRRDRRQARTEAAEGAPSCGSCRWPNPDGYEYTFDHERLWRKNLRDNDGNGQITVGDGVDPNRNYPNHWGYDEEGSSSIPASETYRGPGRHRSPRLGRHRRDCWTGSRFAFQVNYHSNGQWLLYADGWQIGTPTADDPIYYALSGNLDNPAIEDFHPGLSSDVLYVTNGEIHRLRPLADRRAGMDAGALRGLSGLRFRLPRRPRHWCGPSSGGTSRSRDSVAGSAKDPDDPKSVLGIKTKPFYIDSDDPYKRGIPVVQLSFDQVLRRPAEGCGPGQAEPRQGEGEVPHQRRTRYGLPAPMSGDGGQSVRTRPPIYYHQVRGMVRGAQSGRLREGLVQGRRQTQQVVHLRRRLRTPATGSSSWLPRTTQEPRRTRAPGPHYLDYYLDALDGERRRGRCVRRRRRGPGRSRPARRAQPL